MTVLENLLRGFSIALVPTNILLVFVGVCLGTVVGVLPGIGSLGSMALLLPATISLPPEAAIIMLAGIYYGAMYGGSTTSILMNIPGEAPSVVTTLDGYQMTLNGRSGPALTIAAVGSFVAGTISVLGLMLFAPPLSQVALRFGPPEYFAVIVLGFVLLSSLSGGHPLKAYAMAMLGFLLGTVGVDPIYGTLRFTFGLSFLEDGVPFVPVAMGLFGIAELAHLVARRSVGSIHKVPPLRQLLPNRDEWRRSTGPVGRASVLGFLVGLIPGPATVIAAFASYALERRISRHPEQFGRGAIEGVAGPEAANNSAAGGAFVPLMSLGIPFSPAVALLLSALLLHGIQPGPNFITQHPQIFWGLIASMYIGNMMLLILNLPLVGAFVRLMRLPQAVLVPVISLVCLVGAFSLNNRVTDVGLMVLFGGVGVAMRAFDLPPAPLVLALVLGPIMERTFRQSLILTDGSLLVLATRPLAGTLLGLAALLALGPSMLGLLRRRRPSPVSRSPGAR